MFFQTKQGHEQDIFIRPGETILAKFMLRGNARFCYYLYKIKETQKTKLNTFSFNSFSDYS